MPASDLSEYKDMFLAEAGEITANLIQNLLSLEKAPTDSAIIQEIFRGAHTLKGMSATMGYESIMKLSHSIEDVLDKVRKGELIAASAVIDTLLKGVDYLNNLLNNIKENSTAPIELTDIFNELANISSQKADAKVKEPSTGTKQVHEPSAGTLRVDTKLLDELLNLVGELVITKSQLTEMANSMQNEDLNSQVRYNNKIIELVQEKVMKTRIVPIEQLFNRFPLLVRERSREQQKEVELVVEGENIEIDRAIVDGLVEPMTHIINNAVMHGIESPLTRVGREKSRIGKITLRVFRDRGFTVIEIADDGGGMDPAKIREKALREGIIGHSELMNLSDREILMLITSPKFSTAETVTTGAGRGVGMDVVKTRIREMGGTLGIESTIGKGSKIILRLPFTLSIINSLLVKLSEELFCLPFLSVRELITVDRDNITNEDGVEIVKFKNEPLKLINLASVLELNNHSSKQNLNVVVIEASNKKVGLIVDSFVKQQEVVLKPLPYPIESLKPYAGATILGDGKLVLILDINSIV